MSKYEYYADKIENLDTYPVYKFRSVVSGEWFNIIHSDIITIEPVKNDAMFKIYTDVRAKRRV